MGLGIRNPARVHVRHGRSPSEREDQGRRWIELEFWRTERGLQVVKEESVVFSTIEVGDKHAGPSGIRIWR